MNKNTLYLECYAGISGDMAVAALIDAGADTEVLKAALSSLPLSGYQVKIQRVMKSGIDACDFAVLLDAAHENHDHDMAYLHGHDSDTDKATDKAISKEETHTHHHEEHHHEEHHHDELHHEHSHAHHHEQHHHEHRGFQEIRDILEAAELTDGARALALQIFTILAQAEAKAHCKPIEEVHFHEVGAVDSIVDITAVAVCMDDLRKKYAIEDVIVPMLYEGTGTVRCQHGILPIPVPAVSNIMEAYHLPVSIMPIQGEFVTPTGAAIVAALCTGTKLPEQFRIQKIGVGAGKRNYERPSMLRAMVITESADTQTRKDSIYKLESNIDDITGEALGYVLERLFEHGARDVHYTPVYMKKNRPAWQLNVICDKDKINELEQIIFRETTTIGIRRVEMERTVLERRNSAVQTPFGEVVVKVCTIDGQERYYPEYDSVAALCKKTNATFPEVYRAAAAGKPLESENRKA